MDEGGPCLRKDMPGGRHEPRPVAEDKEQDHVDQSIDGPEQVGGEVPMLGDADRMTVTGQAKPRREVSRVIFRGPEAVFWHCERREARPLCTGGTVAVAVESRVVHQDGEPAADQQDQEQKVDVMGDAEPGGETVRRRLRLQLLLGEDGDLRQAEQQILDPGGGDGGERQHDD